MFGFPHVKSDVAQPKDVRHVGGQVLLLSLTSVRDHRTARPKLEGASRLSLVLHVTFLHFFSDAFKIC